MAVFRFRDPKKWEYKALYCGLIPCYVRNITDERCDVAVANGVPEFMMDVVQWMYFIYAIFFEDQAWFDELSYPFLITGEIDDR